MRYLLHWIPTFGVVIVLAIWAFILSVRIRRAKAIEKQRSVEDHKATA